MNIVLNMVVRNEEHRIGPMLEITLPVVDAAIIVVQEGNDQTRTICERMGATVIDDECHDFADPSRPLAYDATPDDAWILCLDADELLFPSFACQMRSLEDHGYVGAQMTFSHWVGGEHQGTGDPHFRFARKANLHVPSVMHELPRWVNCEDSQIFIPPYPAVLHNKSWEEQLEGEEGYERWLQRPGSRESLGEEAWQSLWGMSTHNLRASRALGITGRDIDAMGFDERRDKLGRWNG